MSLVVFWFFNLIAFTQNDETFCANGFLIRLNCLWGESDTGSFKKSLKKNSYTDAGIYLFIYFCCFEWLEVANSIYIFRNFINILNVSFILLKWNFFRNLKSLLDPSRIIFFTRGSALSALGFPSASGNTSPPRSAPFTTPVSARADLLIYFCVSYYLSLKVSYSRPAHTIVTANCAM